jgi:malate dehydrogenase (oxaloacetate-decarboxylating)
MKRAAARAIADIVGDERNAEYVIPSVFDGRVVDAVAEAVRRAAFDEGLARRSLLAGDEENAAVSTVP